MVVVLYMDWLVEPCKFLGGGEIAYWISYASTYVASSNVLGSHLEDVAEGEGQEDVDEFEENEMADFIVDEDDEIVVGGASMRSGISVI